MVVQVSPAPTSELLGIIVTEF